VRPLFRLLGYVTPHLGRLVLAVALALVGALVELARPWPIKVVVDYAFANRPLPPFLRHVLGFLPGGGGRSGILAWSVVAQILIVVLGALLTLAVLYATVDVSRRLVHDLFRDLLEKLQHLSLSYHGRRTVGDSLQRLTNDVFTLFFAVSQIAIPATSALLVLGGMYFIMARIDLVLALIALAALPVLAASLAFFSRPLAAATMRQTDRQGSLLTLIEQSLRGIKVVQGFARERYVQTKVEQGALQLGEAYGSSARIGGAYGVITAVVTGLASAVVLGVGGGRVISGDLSLGDLLVFLGYLTSLYAPVSALAVAVAFSVSAGARAERICEVLDSDEQVPEKPHPVRLGAVRGHVVFDDVTFGYHVGGIHRVVLDGFSFEAHPGNVTALVGPTGAGKTSLVGLLSRFYDPWGGRILLDGHDLRDLSLTELRENVALVLQEPMLFPLSVADNIAFGDPRATRLDVIRAAKVAGAHEFVHELPDGYDTILAENGNALSGGERQRISIARAVLKQAKVLILDEPTSALDARTEAAVFEALSDLTARSTTFIVSHRLSTIRRAQQILTLDGGKIVERGSHEDLLSAGSVYASLHEVHGAAL
jgi:ATP-binding cassette, subfamily B, bacterial